MNNKVICLELLRNCTDAAKILFRAINGYIETGKNKANIAYRLSVLDYSILNLLNEMFPDKVEEITEEARLIRADHYLSHVLRRLDRWNDKGVFWIKCGQESAPPNFVGHKDDYEIIGDLILRTIDESDRNERLMDEIVDYVNKRMASDDWRE